MIRGLLFGDLVRSVMDLFAPRDCVVCGAALSMREKHICVGCLADLPRTHFSSLRCNQLADRFNALIQRDIDANGGVEDYAFAASLFFYRSQTGYRKITQRLKYHADFSAGKYFSAVLGKELSASPLFKDVDVVIPVPLHWYRKWSRGFNQAEVIAAELAKVLNAPLRCDVLRRPRHTRTQTKLSKESKMRNVAGAFAARGRPGSFSHILLVDDVFTTGATLHSCFLALRTVYPSSVRISVATLACVGK